ncbi:hypothetical protein ACWYBU_09840 [Fusobacterium polymorphum]
MGIFTNLNNNLYGMKEVKETEEIKEVKVLTMNDVFNELKEKINKYKELSRNSEGIEVDNSEIFKIEEEIKNLKAKIDELNSSTEGKSKIEKMKITLNVSSIESEITLKEMDLEEEKQKNQKEYGKKVQSSKKDLENIKDNLNTFIKDTEENLENAVKSIVKKQDSNNLKLTTLQEQSLNKLGLTISDLSGITLTKLELEALRIISSYTKEELRKLNTPETNNINQSMGAIAAAISVQMQVYNTIPNGADIKPVLKRLINIKNNKMARQKLIEGTDLEEVKKYYDNIMKVELLNLENIEKEETELDKKIRSIKENMNRCDILAKKSKIQHSEENFRKYSNLALEDNNKLLLFEKENEKLKIKKEAIENKINTINEMVDEMIKEVIKEELKKREIVIPDFVSVTKYFNAPNEIEE